MAERDSVNYPMGLGDLETLNCRMGDVVVEAIARPDIPFRFMFEGWHPQHGLRYFRARRRGAGVQVWDVTEAYARCAILRLKRGRDKRKAAGKEQRKRLKAEVEYNPPPGVPTRERRRKGAIAREKISDPETGDLLLIRRAPDNLVAMHKRGTITRVQLEAAMAFHETFILANLDPQRAANMYRVPDSPGGGEADQVLDAKAEVWSIYDHLGGRNSLSARILRAIVGKGRSVNECVRFELGGGCSRAMQYRISATLSAALDGVCGYHDVKHRHNRALRIAAKDAVTGALSQGA